MNYVVAVCPRCGAEFTFERGRTYECPFCGNVTTEDIGVYDLSVETGRTLYSAYVALRGGDIKGAFKLYKAAAKTDKKNPAPLFGMLFCKHGVKFEDGRLKTSDGKSLTRDGLCKKMFKLSDSERKKHYTELLYKIDIEPRVKIVKQPKPTRLADFRIKDGELRYYKGDDEDIVIPSSVSKISCFAFLSAKNVKSVYVPSSVERISDRAFTTEPPIERITVDPESARFVMDGGCLIDKKRSAVMRATPGAVIPEYVTAIDDYAFEKCVDMTEIVIPNGVTTVGEYAFGACEKLKRVVIPASVTEIGEGAFSFCKDITKFDVAADNDAYCEKDGGLYDVKQNMLVRCGADGKIPSGTKTLGVSSFDGGEFTELNIPASVTEIGDRAIDGCDELVKLTVDKNNPVYACVNNCLIDKTACTLVAAVGDYTVPDDGSIKIIGEGAFRYSKLKSVKIPSSVQIIDDCAYADSELESVQFNEGLEVIGEMSFTGCDGITSLKFPSTLKSIGEEAFGNCDNLKSINIPASVQCIDINAFLFCDELDSVKFEVTSGWTYDWDEPVDGKILSNAYCAADIIKDGKKLVRKV